MPRRIPLTPEQIEAASAGADHPQNASVAAAKAAEERDAERRRAPKAKRQASISPELLAERERLIAEEAKLSGRSVSKPPVTRGGK